MDKKTFKKVISEVLSGYGFKVGKDKCFRAETNELIVVIGLQKSNYSEVYYINYGFLIKLLSPDLTAPRDYQCDVKGRFIFGTDGIAYESLNEDKFTTAFISELEKRVKPVLDSGLKKYFELFPNYTITANLKAKKYLNMV